MFEEKLDFEGVDFKDDFWVADGAEGSDLREVMFGGGEVAAGRMLVMVLPLDYVKSHR